MRAGGGLYTPLKSQTLPLNLTSTDFGKPKFVRRSQQQKVYLDGLRQEIEWDNPLSYYRTEVPDPELLTVAEFNELYPTVDIPDEIWVEKLPDESEKLALKDGREIAQKRMNSLKKKLLEGKPSSLGVRITPSFTELISSNLGWSPDIGNLINLKGYENDTQELELKAFIGEIMHFFSFLIVYNYFLYKARLLHLTPEQIFEHFFFEYNSPIYLHKLNDDGRFDLKSILETLGKANGLQSEEVLSESSEIHSRIEIPRTNLPVAVRRALEDLNTYLESLAIKEEYLGAMGSEDLLNGLINYGQRICRILDSQGNNLVKYDKNTRRNKITVMAEQPIIVNTKPASVDFYPKSFSNPIRLTNKKGKIEKITALIEECQTRYPGEFWVDDSHTIHITSPIDLYNMQMVCKPDLMVFGSDCVMVYDHKLSPKNIHSPGMMLNAFFYRLVAGILLMNNIRSANAPVMLSDVDLEREGLEEIVLYKTKFYLVFFDAKGREQIIEVLSDLDSFQYYQLKMQLKYTGESSIVYGDILKNELKS